MKISSRQLNRLIEANTPPPELPAVGEFWQFCAVRGIFYPRGFVGKILPHNEVEAPHGTHYCLQGHLVKTNVMILYFAKEKVDKPANFGKVMI